jgi:divalent metal cation (Fe/Co/Zn/Cd) transporter
VRVRWEGHRLAASSAVIIDDHLSVAEGHLIGETVGQELTHHVNHLDDVEIHVDPSGRHPHLGTTSSTT